MLSFFRLPSADDLFMRYFDRWYSQDAREVKHFKATRPDSMTFEHLIGKTPAELSPWSDEVVTHQLERVEKMFQAALTDLPKVLDVDGPVNLRWVELADTYHNRKRVRELIKISPPEDYANEYIVTACELGAVLGHVMKWRLARLEWVAGVPYWESALFDPVTGTIIPIFHWAIKKLSRSALNHGLVEKIEATVRHLDGEQMPGWSISAKSVWMNPTGTSRHH